MQDTSDQKNGKKSFQIKFLCTECKMSLSKTEVHEMLTARRMTRHLCRYCLGVAEEVILNAYDASPYEIIRIEEILKELYEDRPERWWIGSRWTPEEAVEHNRRYIFYRKLYYKLTGRHWKEPVPKMSFSKRSYLETHYPGSYPKKEENCEWC